MGCFGSHGTTETDARADADAGMEPPRPRPPVPDSYDVPPAPGEGVECPELLAPAPPCVAGGGGICDASALRRALADAHTGDVVRVGNCRVTGSFSVPAGITLAGSGPDATVIVAPAGRPAVVVTPNDTPTVVRCFAAEANGAAGVSFEGAGEARAEHLTIRVDTGIGLGATDLDRLSMHDLEVTGSVRADNAEDQPSEPTPDDAATIGIALAGVREAMAYGTSIRGFAEAGLHAMNTNLTLRATEIREVLPTNVRVVGGHTCVRDLTADHALQGTRLIPAYGLVVAGGGRFVGADVSVTRSEGYAILVDGSSVELDALTLEGSANAGLWVQEGAEAQISDAHILDNHFAGVRACDASSISISSSEIRGTRNLTRIVGTMPVEIGAGVLLGSSAHVHLAGLEISDNDTVGLVVDLGAGAIAEIDDVRVSGPDRGFGALAFDDLGWVESGGWDDGVTREGTVAANDFTDPSTWPLINAVRCPMPRP